MSKNAIRGFHYDPIKNFVFTGSIDDGEICVFDIKKPGKVKKKHYFLQFLIFFAIFNIFFQKNKKKKKKEKLAKMEGSLKAKSEVISDP